MPVPIQDQPNKNTNGLDQNPENINRKGRPKKIYTILKESGFSADDIRTAFGEVAWYNKSDLSELIGKEDTPIILQVIGKAYIEAADNGKYIYVKEILEQFMGKALQKTQEVTTPEGSEIAELSQEQQLAILEIIEKGDSK